MCGDQGHTKNNLDLRHIHVKILHVLDSSSVHYQLFFTVHTAMVVSYRFVDNFRAGSGWNAVPFHPDPACKLSADLCDLYHCCVYSKKTSDGGQRNCPKHVEFHSKKKFEKLVHLVGFL
jgi:hypothetical protein